jgi:hypothetical protein
MAGDCAIFSKTTCVIATTKFHLSVAIGRISKSAFVQLRGQTDRPTAVAFLEASLQIVTYRLHAIPTDNSIQFVDHLRNRNSWTARYQVHRFDQICNENGIEHRLTKPKHP